jgi:hypothetical protein
MSFKSAIGLSLLILLFVIPFAAFASGERQVEMDMLFPKACADCHSDNPKFPVAGTRLGYDTSGHKNNDNAYYANGGGCQQCHTNEGFIEFVETGTVGEYVANPSQPGCFTCHVPHTKGDFSLRTTKPAKLADGSIFDLGDGNLCANCHQARRSAVETVKASDAKDVSGHWGAHHGPQSDIVNGTNAFENPAKGYSNSPHKLVVKDGCASCHMALPEGRYSFSAELGGHSFNIAGEVHEAGKLNISACSSCHKDIKQVQGTEIYDLKAKADYDLDGSVEPFQSEVQGLLDAFVNANGTGYLQRLNPPMYKADGSWAYSKNGSWNIEEMAALYNYKFFLEDRSLGVHNGTYTIQVLYDSLKALDPSLDDSLRPR